MKHQKYYRIKYLDCAGLWHSIKLTSILDPLEFCVNHLPHAEKFMWVPRGFRLFAKGRTVEGPSWVPYNRKSKDWDGTGSIPQDPETLSPRMVYALTG